MFPYYFWKFSVSKLLQNKKFTNYKVKIKKKIKQMRKCFIKVMVLWWPRKIGGNATENMGSPFQQYEKLCKGPKKTKLTMLEERHFFWWSSRYTHGACMCWKWCVRLGLCWIEMMKSKSLSSPNIAN